MRFLGQQFCLCIICGSSLAYVLVIYKSVKTVLTGLLFFFEIKSFSYIYIFLVCSVIIATKGTEILI